MSKVTKQQAIEFLNNISNKDNIAIIHHDDSDGICSAILFQDHCTLKGAKTKNIFYNLGETKFKDLKLEEFNKIIITDVSIKDTYKQLEDLKNHQVFYTDHHPVYDTPKEIETYFTEDQGYIPSSRTAYELVKGKNFLALLGTIADAGNLYKENDSFIAKILKELNLTLEKFQENYSHVFSDTLVYFEKSPQKTFDLFSKISSLEEISKLKKYANKIEEEIKKTVQEAKEGSEKISGINFYSINPKYKIKGIVAAIISRENTKEPHIFFSTKSSNSKFLGISARHNSDSADLPKLLEAGTKNLEDSISGGHPRASGGQILAKDLEKFKQNVKDYMKK
jgi:single-stranded DNA-specific DHH superfamily exonuclease